MADESDPLDGIVDGLVAADGSFKSQIPDDPEEVDAWLNQIPLFARKRPPKEKQGVAWQMIEALEDLTQPEEKADELKRTGNECFKAGRSRWKDAVEYYTQALECESENAELDSSILANRALVQLRLENFGRAIEDSKEAVKLWPDNVKAYCRAGQASAKLDKHRQALRWYQHALDRADAKSKAYVEKLVKTTIKAEARDEARALEAKKAAEAKREADALLAKAIELRKVRISSDTLSGEHRPSLDEKGNVHWPVVFLYPEFLQSDVVQDVHELTALTDHLAEMFPPKGSAPPWDRKGVYTLGNLEVFVEIEADKPHTVVRLPPGTLLAKALTVKKCVVKGVPTFFVVSKVSPYAKRFAETHNILGA